VLKWISAVACAAVAAAWASSVWLPVHCDVGRCGFALGWGCVRFSVLGSATPSTQWAWKRLYPQEDRIHWWPSMSLHSLVSAVLIPLWMLSAAMFVSTAVFWRLDRQHIPLGHCRRCGYNLTGNVSGRCPECGAAVGDTKL
jgi:hypothetical protein